MLQPERKQQALEPLLQLLPTHSCQQPAAGKHKRSCGSSPHCTTQKLPAATTDEVPCSNLLPLSWQQRPSAAPIPRMPPQANMYPAEVTARLAGLPVSSSCLSGAREARPGS